MEKVRPTSLAFEDLNFETVKGKKILKGCTGFIPPKTLCGILGPSGCGKTTLLDTLASRRKKGGSLKSGRILLNGVELKPRERQKLVSYLSQEDILYESLTVRETIRFAFRFVQGFSVKPQQLDEEINALLEKMGLLVCADVRVGNPFDGKGISGGQRRRLGLAVELVSVPSILILDEPTTGLDFSAAFSLVQQLDLLTQQGHSVVCVIHQPSTQIWETFHQVGFLYGGSIVYFGPLKNLVDYFSSIGQECPSSYNPAEFVMSLLTPEFDDEILKIDQTQEDSVIAELITSYENSKLKKEVKAQIDGELQREADSFMLQLEDGESTTKIQNSRWNFNIAFLFQRNIINLFRNPSVLASRFILIAILSVIVGLTFYKTGNKTDEVSVRGITSICFFVPSFFTLMSVALIPNFLKEKAVVLKEIQNQRYSVLSFAFAALFFQLLSSLLLAVTSALITFYMCALRNLGIYFLLLFMDFAMTEIILISIAAIVNNYVIGMLLGVLVLASGMSVMGYFNLLNRIVWPLRWLGYVVPPRYYFKAFMRNQFETIGNISSPEYPTGPDYLEFYDVIDGVPTLSGDIAICGAFAVASLLGFLVAIRGWHPR